MDPQLLQYNVCFVYCVGIVLSAHNSQQPTKLLFMVSQDTYVFFLEGMSCKPEQIPRKQEASSLINEDSEPASSALDYCQIEDRT